MDDTNKRVIVAFAVSFAILMVWKFAFPPPEPPASPSKAPAAAQTQPAAPKPDTTPAPPSGKTTVPRAAAKLAPAAPVELPVQQGKKAEEIVIENDAARVTLSTEGAVVKSWILRKFRDEKGEPLDVVNRAACETLGFPLSLKLSDEEMTTKLNSALFVATPEGPTLKAPTKLELVYSDGKVQARKVLSFGPAYEVHVEASVTDGQRFLPVEVAWPGGFGDQSLAPQAKAALDRVLYGGAEKFENVVQRKVEEERTIPGPFEIAGMDDRYFLNVFLPDAPDQVFFRVSRRTWNPPEWKEKEPPKETTAALGTQQTKPLAFRLFVGPKDLDVLRSVNPPLDHVVDFGWFSFVAKPLFLVLRYIHDHWIQNYGWAIVLLTIIINLAMFPLRLKQIRSAQEMQRVAPIVKGIQDKYKQYKFNDPRKQKMNQEIMKLYQEHGINPLGGCLPMVIQLPFLYGFYRVLDLSIELRHAPWIGYIKDLSAPDHYYVLLAVMIITMFVLQRMTPMTTADPMQQRMFMIMPIFFGVMFYRVASGLVLYWMTSNCVQIGQQVFINRMIPRPSPVPAPRKAAGAKE
ncbi:MAG: membrane protein insertase YidC [Acidobacteriia bacterium]|nr:membrane protein insertase YidC [Terriglobia bacterium]